MAMTAPGNCPRAMSAFMVLAMRASRSGEKPRLAGVAGQNAVYRQLVLVFDVGHLKLRASVSRSKFPHK